MKTRLKNTIYQISYDEVQIFSVKLTNISSTKCNIYIYILYKVIQ